jgi:hypothetical protein
LPQTAPLPPSAKLRSQARSVMQVTLLASRLR